MPPLSAVLADVEPLLSRVREVLHRARLEHPNREAELRTLESHVLGDLLGCRALRYWAQADEPTGPAAAALELVRFSAQPADGEPQAACDACGQRWPVQLSGLACGCGGQLVPLVRLVPVSAPDAPALEAPARRPAVLHLVRCLNCRHLVTEGPSCPECGMPFDGVEVAHGG